MNLIEQRSKIWGETPYTKDDAVQWIEQAGRVCYRSEDKIVEGSGLKFVNNIWKRKHFSVIEHSNLIIRRKEKSKFPNTSREVDQMVFKSKYFSFATKNDRTYIAGNWRAWIEFYQIINDECYKKITLDNITTIFDSNIYETVTDPNDIPDELKCFTVEFTTDRAVTHELVRHRPASYSQESQRYVRYGDINFVKPSWYDKASETEQNYFLVACSSAEEYYGWFLKYAGMKAEDARVILPNCTATKIVMTASISEWKHVFNLRTSKAAYGQIRNLLQPVFEEFVYNGWIH